MLHAGLEWKCLSFVNFNLITQEEISEHSGKNPYVLLVLIGANFITYILLCTRQKKDRTGTLNSILKYFNHRINFHSAFSRKNPQI